VVNARLAWRPPTGPWEVALSATNLTDERYAYNAFDLRGVASWVTIQPAPPRMWAVSVRRSLRGY
jgi:outer membrane receptor protein involved in Fe transport